MKCESFNEHISRELPVKKMYKYYLARKEAAFHIKK